MEFITALMPFFTLCLFSWIIWMFVHKRSTKHTNPDKHMDIIKSFPEISMNYIDSEGHKTTREISGLTLKRYGYFNAYCHLRKEIRTFHIERIVAASNYNTGEKLLSLPVKTLKGTTKYLKIKS